eukprot:CAMPEP_0181168260 /NCGR_PEP_ID=MMETSP1096-20121128/173_1 /TAXON_ID=156174 ORGANISM="Chrysochromulina ericina, Strain CCMP281" /NCGR_SAMPLE_ID=MMETSP1096 /ASSEMBLY_ACC=CAM_ASM_000453 /LENGTH=162 /DNA_ID=CAMNT_0023255613 /DNA_START=213 /DNA_END=696 /DNA_ORIENTATION=+
MTNLDRSAGVASLPQVHYFLVRLSSGAGTARVARNYERARAPAVEACADEALIGGRTLQGGRLSTCCRHQGTTLQLQGQSSGPAHHEHWEKASPYDAARVPVTLIWLSGREYGVRCGEVALWGPDRDGGLIAHHDDHHDHRDALSRAATACAAAFAAETGSA